jgi:multisubunit Na+/H+ antiporter MnhB subunit
VIGIDTIKHRILRLAASAASLVAVSLLAPAVVLAQSPTADQYSPIAQHGGGGGGSTVGFLPFTGLDVVALAIAGAALLLAGVALHRRTRRGVA